MIDFKLSLQSDNILLRPTIGEDITGFAELTADKKMWVYFTSDLSDRVELENWVNDALIQKENKTRLPLTSILKSEWPEIKARNNRNQYE